MDHISVNDTAKKFASSEKRITEDEKLLSLKEVCKILTISTATGRNWIKLGKLIPEYYDKKSVFFTKESIYRLKSDIKSGKILALKSRRNKKFVSGNALYNSYVSEKCANIEILQKILSAVSFQNIELDSKIISYMVADCAIHLLVDKLQIRTAGKSNYFKQFLKGEIRLEKYELLIISLVDDKEAALVFCDKHSFFFEFDYSYEPDEDILGLVYISCKNIGNRKATGSYYTPTSVVKKLISKLDLKETTSILDPCCGTGNFLLQLPQNIDFENVFGNDIDSISVKIARLNMALRYPEQSIEKICEHITELNYLTEYNRTGFDCIIGNPPWGYAFSEEEKAVLRKKYSSAGGKNMESYDVFMECALSNLVDGGQLSYVLPEAVLNVKAHSKIRKIIISKSSIRYLDFLGNTFDGVQCPCIIFQLTYTNKPLSTVGLVVNDGKKTFGIKTERHVSQEYFSFTATDEEYQILKKVREHKNITFLLENAEFALGIVTGNNKKYISNMKEEYNEMVLKGADISRYHINETNNYIVFKPESFQQVAPAVMYRAPEKLFYRFISSQLVFAYDNQQTLSLNSCNIVIPKLDGIDMKYVLAILNSRISQFIYQKEFHSVKVLRSHIESIPIPVIDLKGQREVVEITNQLIAEPNLEIAKKLYDEIDLKIVKMFGLSETEYNVIKNAVTM